MVKIYIFIFNINIIQMVMLIWIGLYRSSQLIQPSHLIPVTIKKKILNF